MSKYQGISKSKAVQIGTIAPKRKRSKKDEQEFGLAKKEYVVCRECKSVYFDKAWHHSLQEDTRHPHPDGKGMKPGICPACRMKKDKTFEGEVLISLGDGKLAARRDIMNLIKNSDGQARAKDPMDRILWLEENGNEIRVFTSENQLAVRIGKKLDASFKGGALEISHSHGEDIIRVHWKY